MGYVIVNFMRLFTMRLEIFFCSVAVPLRYMVYTLCLWPWVIDRHDNCCIKEVRGI